jgi:NADH-quinone oxidoreductase subunit N
VYLGHERRRFAVVVARERETRFGDHIDAVAGIGATRPLLAWPLTIAMLSLAGIPATGGFIGKVSLLQAAVDGGWTWLAIAIVLGSAASLAYYLRVVAAMWMRPAETAAVRPVPALAGGSQDLDPPEEPQAGAVSASGVPAARRTHWEVALVAILAAVATLAAGIYPDPLFDVARDASESFRGLL